MKPAGEDGVGHDPKQYARTRYELSPQRGAAPHQDWLIAALTQSDALGSAEFRAAFTKHDSAGADFEPLVAHHPSHQGLFWPKSLEGPAAVSEPRRELLTRVG